MKKLLILTTACVSLLFSQESKAQTLQNLINQANTLLGGGKGNTGNIKNLNNSEVVSGLKEALKIGTQNASQKLNRQNGYFGNQLIRIALPQEVKKVEATLRQFGFGKQCDQLILSLNRAAEDAAGKAVPIFVNAILSMNIQDGMNILKGGNNAATNFLQRTTTNALTQAFRPVIQKSLDKVNATKYWRTVFSTYNALPISKQKINPDLTGYVTERALSGLFTTVAQEEQNIRQNPAARVTDLLRKVFGG
ncbi:MAG: DUF4197 domain-containing protein [Chitinophagaceae bacterium]